MEEFSKIGTGTLHVGQRQSVNISGKVHGHWV